MFADIVGSTEMTARLGDVAAMEVVHVHDAPMRRALRLFDDREVKHTGDGIVTSFEDVTNAVRAGAEIQRLVAAFNDEAVDKWPGARELDGGFLRGPGAYRVDPAHNQTEQTDEAPPSGSTGVLGSSSRTRRLRPA